MLPGAISNTPKSCLKTFAVHRRKKKQIQKSLERTTLCNIFKAFNQLPFDTR